MKAVIAGLACMLVLPAGAQVSQLPEGSVDMSVAVLVGSMPAAPGSAARSTFMLPQFTAEWSNGVFLDGLAAGIQLSDDSLLRYGPMIALDLGAQRTDGSRSGIRPVYGAFVNFTPVHELSLHAHTVFPTSRDGRGALLNLKADTGATLAPHHSLNVGLGVNLADSASLQSAFGNAHYQPSGGVRDVFADVRWRWEMNRKWTLTASLQASRLQGSAAVSPRTLQRTGVASWLALGYGF